MTKLDMDRIASLNHHPGFTALIRLMDESDTILLGKLEKELSPEVTNNLLGKWRANRQFRNLIADRPAALFEELGVAVSEL